MASCISLSVKGNGTLRILTFSFVTPTSLNEELSFLACQKLQMDSANAFQDGTIKDAMGTQRHPWYPKSLWCGWT